MYKMTENNKKTFQKQAKQLKCHNRTENDITRKNNSENRSINHKTNKNQRSVSEKVRKQKKAQVNKKNINL